ncbi:MAG: pyridoxamine 5'-phosphate oxidase family protein [Aphanocapsa sp. GSE-SYN-MK-11-07L]|jgi:PPOX class probable FMN-dependent enzyme|nr:pyridoxamine 5'-phosphate oxidase family protein [Aphanocapsa sp. GSE-SYN-MK-11-07L]
MTLAPWRSPLARALHRNRSLAASRYPQLATVKPDGRPANRTIVFRGFWSQTNHLQFITDQRSQKVEQLQHSAWGELCWYFGKTREQFRLAGKLSLITAAQPDPSLASARTALWQNLSDSARQQFAWPNPGGNWLEKPAFTPDLPDAQIPLPNFCLLLLEPTQVDHLELRGEPQNRWLYQQQTNGEWSLKSINP